MLSDDLAFQCGVSAYRSDISGFSNQSDVKTLQTLILFSDDLLSF